MKYQNGLLIGRFQPLHFGHVYVFKKALEQVGHIIVGVGSAQEKQIHESENPFSFNLRKRMLEEMKVHEKFGDRVKAVIPLVDDPDDDVWRGHVLEKTGPVDVVISNNDWVTGIFKQAGIPFISVPLYKREFYEGKKIREILKDSESYHDYLPEYVWKIIETS